MTGVTTIDVDAATLATDAAVASGDIEAIRAALTAERRERALDAADGLRRALQRNKVLAAECSEWAAKYLAEVERATHPDDEATQ